MEQGVNMNAQVSFLEAALTLIHIPLDLYWAFIQPILKILLPPSQDPTGQNTASLSSITSQYQHVFLNISVTPIECSIVCDSAWAESEFIPAIKRLPKDKAKSVLISKDKYAALCVITGSLDAGSRVADLTSPLALANIPIFFITTYYSDFILVPIRDRQAVVKTLLGKGFVFSQDDQSRLITPASGRPHSSSYSNNTVYPYTHDWSSAIQSRASNYASENCVDPNTTPPSPPPPSPPLSPTATLTALDELQERTFSLLKKRHVVPYVQPNLTLVHCTGIQHHSSSSSPRGASNGGSRRNSRPSWVDTIDAKLHTALVAALVSQPRFVSVTFAMDDPPSLLLDRELLPLFGGSLVGPTGEGAGLVPVFLDLADLPFEATGIVSGVAGRLVKEMGCLVSDGERAGGGELSYLSTARAGAVILEEGVAGEAMAVLKRGLVEEQ